MRVMLVGVSALAFAAVVSSNSPASASEEDKPPPEDGTKGCKPPGGCK
jgi:hypothetical protein